MNLKMHVSINYNYIVFAIIWTSIVSTNQNL